MDPADLSRRSFVSHAAIGTGVAVGAVMTAGGDAAAVAPAAIAPAALPDDRHWLELTVNGTPRRLAIDPRTTLLDLLREHLALTGAKPGCNHGQCGACTVHLDGRRVLSCLTLAVTTAGRAVTTIEGLADGDRLHPLQQAFVDHDALQCGYCTPGQIMSGVACIGEGHAGSEATIREFMSGNLCRCGAYPKIVAAVVQARQALEA